MGDGPRERGSPWGGGGERTEGLNTLDLGVGCRSSALKDPPKMFGDGGFMHLLATSSGLIVTSPQPLVSLVLAHRIPHLVSIASLPRSTC